MASWTPNFTWITDALAVGGSFPPDRAGELAREHRIAAVVDLRIEACDDEALLRRHGVTLLHLPTVDWFGTGPELTDRGVEFVVRHLDSGARALIHCQHGIGRSAVLALCVLVARGAAPLDALELAKGRRAAVSPSPAQYEAWASWLAARKSAYGAPWEVPSFDAFAAIAYRHLAGK